MSLLVSYCAVVLASLFFAFFTNRNGKPFIISIIIIAILAGLFSVSISWAGVDFYDRHVYEVWYENTFPLYLKHPNLIASSSQQPGWIVFNLICLQFSRRVEFLFFVIAFIFTFTNLLFFRTCRIPFFIAVVLYTALPGIIYSAAWCRQIVAASIFVVALIALQKRHFLVALAINFVAATVHITVAVMLPILTAGILLNRSAFLNSKSVKAVIALLILAALASPVIIAFLQHVPILNEYVSSSSFEGDAGSVATILKGLPFFLSLLLAWINLKELPNWSIGDLGAHLIVLAFGCTAWLSAYVVYWTVRLPVYSIPSTVALLCGMVNGGKKYNHIVIACIYICSLVITLRESVVLFS